MKEVHLVSQVDPSGSEKPPGTNSAGCPIPCFLLPESGLILSRPDSCISFLSEMALLSVSSRACCCHRLACGFSLYLPALQDLTCLPGVPSTESIE